MTTDPNDVPAPGQGAGEPHHLTQQAELEHPALDAFGDPGLPEHLPRYTDVEERAARWAARQVVALFILAVLLTIGFVWVYVDVDIHASTHIPALGLVNKSNFFLGLTFGLSLFCIGVGTIHWARKLMSATELVEARHAMKSSAADTAIAADLVRAGIADSAVPRRKLVFTSMLGALATFPVPIVVLLRDMGPLPHKALRTTLWDDPKNRQITAADSGAKVRPQDFEVASILSAVPPGDPGRIELAKSAILLVRLSPEDINSVAERNAGYQGIVAFSKICTHAGCPLGLYEHTTHHMLCPCHQSTFDLSRGGKVIFGPAARSLPQLPITVDADGYLVARSGFGQPVGPSFWERGGVGK